MDEEERKKEEQGKEERGESLPLLLGLLLERYLPVPKELAQ